MNLFAISDQTPRQLPEGKADFLLAGSVTRTCEINGITQAGIPGMIPLTPTLDAEFITTGKVLSLPTLAKTPAGVPTPALITRAVHNLAPFSCIKVLDLGLEKEPQECDVIHFDIHPSQSIIEGADIDAQAIFDKGRAAGAEYKKEGDYIILGESTPAGTTTALASAVTMGYTLEDAFASSYAQTPEQLKSTVIDHAFRNVMVEMNTIERLSLVSDNMLLFCAGFVLSVSEHSTIVLAGGTQMASCLLIADMLSTEQEIDFNPENIMLATTEWIRNDVSSDIAAILAELNFGIVALYGKFNFESANIPVLHAYDEGEAKEGVGAGAAIAYGYTQDLDNDMIVREIERIMQG